MAIGDRVTVGTGYCFTKDEKQKVMAYKPQIKEGGGPVISPDGSHVMTNRGGVTCGSTGIIRGEPINVHRSYLHNPGEYSTPTYGNDFVKMLPVHLDEYQEVVFFPIDNVRLFGTI